MVLVTLLPGDAGDVAIRPGALAVRAEGWHPSEGTSGAGARSWRRHLVLVPQRTLEVVAGYRLGDLRDPDFAVTGGPGWFVTFEARVSKGTLAPVADFWRLRLSARQE